MLSRDILSLPMQRPKKEVTRMPPPVMTGVMGAARAETQEAGGRTREERGIVGRGGGAATAGGN